MDIILMRGVQGSGKTFVATKYCALYNATHISRDFWRNECRILKAKREGKVALDLNEYFPFDRNEEKVRWAQYLKDTLLLNSEYAAVIDQTLISPKAINECLQTVFNTKLLIENITLVTVYKPLEECLTNNSKRTGFDRVPEDVIKRAYESFMKYKEINKKTFAVQCAMNGMPPNCEVHSIIIDGGELKEL